MCLVPYIIGSHESNLSESDGVSLVSAYVTSKFSDCKPLLQKALLSKMSDAVRKFLGLSDLAPTKPVVKKAERSGRGTPRPGDDVEHKRMFGSNPSSDTGPAVTSPKASPPRKKVGAAGGNSDDEGDDTTDVGAGKLAGTTGSWLDVDLSKEDCDIAYAEPLSTELVSAAYVIAMTGWMGVDAARAAFSHDWRAR